MTENQFSRCNDSHNFSEGIFCDSGLPRSSDDRTGSLHTPHSHRQGFLTGSPLRFPQQSPTSLDPYKNFIAAQQHKYQPELVSAKRFPEVLPSQSVHPDNLRPSAESSAPAVSLSVPTWPHAPGPFVVQSLGTSRPGALSTQGSALTAAAHRATSTECAPQQRGIFGHWSAFTSRPRHLTKTSCTSALNTALEQAEPDYEKELK